MTATERIIRGTTASVVAGGRRCRSDGVLRALIALVRVHGEAGGPCCLVPLTVDRLIYASAMVMLAPEPQDPDSGAGAVAALPGHRATLAANVAHGLGEGLSAQQ